MIDVDTNAQTERVEMRILHIRSASFVGGPERQIVGLLSRTRSYEHTVASFVKNRIGNVFLNYAKEAGLDILPLEISCSFDPRCIVKLLNYVRKNNIGVVCTHDYRADFFGAVIRRVLSVNHVAFLRGWTSENRKVALYEKADRIVLRGVDVVVAVSESKAREMKSMGIEDTKLTIIPNSIDIDGMRIDTERDIRKEFGIPNRTIIVGSVGRLSPEKGHRFMVEALRQILKEIPETVYLLVGDGVEKEGLRELARNLGIERKILFAGWRDDALSVMRGMDIVVLPSLTEGLPNVLLEAAALGKAIVSTSVGGCGEIIQTGKTGILVEPRSSVSLCSALVELLRDPSSAEEYGRAVRAFVREHFGFDKGVSAYRSTIDKLLGRRKSVQQLGTRI